MNTTIETASVQSTYSHTELGGGFTFCSWIPYYSQLESVCSVNKHEADDELSVLAAIADEDMGFVQSCRPRLVKLLSDDNS